MAATTQHLDNPAPAAGLLAAISSTHDGINDLEIRKFTLAVDWADLHPATSLDDAATIPGTEGELAIAGPGAPLVAEFCVPEFALAINTTTDAGHKYLGDAIETRYRLPRLWAQIIAGSVPVWKARRIAQATHSLPMDGAGFVDRHLAPIADKLSYAQLDRTIEEARTRYDPDTADQHRRDAADSRHFDLHTDQVSYDGTIHLDAELDLADALDLQSAITQIAEQLADLGCKEPLDIRRAIAAGHLARHHLTLNLNPHPATTHPANTRPAGKTVKPRQVVIYVHLSDHAMNNGGIGRLKTHSAWTYHRTGPLSFLWTSPHGIHYPVDLTNVVNLFREP